MISNDYRYDLSIVIACYNEAGHLENSVNELCAVLNDTSYSYELFFIDDCSHDKTRDVIKKICDGNGENYRYVFHSTNVGRGATVKEGLLSSRGKYAGFIDIDLEVHARYVPSMLQVLKSGYDVAIARRVYNLLQLGGFLRTFLSVSYSKIVKYYLGVQIKDTETGYKFFNLATTRDIIKVTKNPKWFWDTEIIAEVLKADKKVKEVDCLFVRNVDKKSTVRLIPDILDYIIAIKKYKHENK